MGSISENLLFPSKHFLSALVGVCPIFPAALGVLPFLFDNTTCHVRQRIYIPNFIMSLPNGKLVYMVWSCVFHRLMGMTSFTVTITSVLVILVEAGKSLKPSIPQKCDKINGTKVNSTSALSFSQAVQVYRQTFIIWESFMEFGFILYPGLILAAYFINVVTTYSCLKLHNELPVTMVVMLFLIDVAVLGNTVVFQVLPVLEIRVNGKEKS